MIEAMNKLKAGKLSEINTVLTYQLMRWCSGHYGNLKICNEANKLFYKLKPKYILSLLYFGIDKRIDRIKYPKPTKIKNEKIDILRKYLTKLYGWSNKEFNNEIIIINRLSNDTNYVNDLNKKVGFSQQECKIMGIEYKSTKEIFKQQKEMSLFDF
jgi:hypothetical protein